MAGFDLPFGVQVSNDDNIDKGRGVVATITERDALLTNGKVKEGQRTYVIDTKLTYELKGSTNADWKEIGAGAITFTELTDAATADLPTINAPLAAALAALGGNSKPYVIVASGQSNMDGAGSGGVMPTENANVKMFDLTTRNFRNVSYTNRLSRTNINTGNQIGIPSAAGNNNLAFSFAHKLHKETGRKVYLIIVSNGGAHIGRWMGTEAADKSAYTGGWGGVGVDKPLYVELKDAVEDALTEIGISEIDAFLWHQGETKRPNNISVSDYERDFNIFYNQLKSENWYGEDVKFIAGELVTGSRYDEYQEFIRSLSYNDNPNIRVATTRGLEIEPESNETLKIHYDGESLYELGKRYLLAFSGDRASFANRHDKLTTFYGATDIDFLITGKYTDTVNIDPLKGRILEHKGIAPIRTGGGFLAGQVVGQPTSCTVIHNTDGTFTVTPNGVIYRDWEFTLTDYWIAGPATTRAVKIKGKVNPKIETKVKLWIDATASQVATINVGLNPNLNSSAQNNLLTINWGDSTTDTGLASGTGNSHTYSTAFSGYVEIIAPINASVTSLNISAGAFAFKMSDLQDLKDLFLLSVSSSANKVFGDLADLPDRIETITLLGSNLVTWDMSSLPNLKSIEVRGQSTIRATRGRVWGGSVPFTRFQVGGVNYTSTELDNVLIALQDIKQATGASPLIYLSYGSQARTAASDAAVLKLENIGFNVVTP